MIDDITGTSPPRVAVGGAWVTPHEGIPRCLAAVVVMITVIVPMMIIMAVVAVRCRGSDRGQDDEQSEEKGG